MFMLNAFFKYFQMLHILLRKLTIQLVLSATRTGYSEYIVDLKYCVIMMHAYRHAAAYIFTKR